MERSKRSRLYWRRQPPEDRICGQIAVAVLCGVSVEAVVDFLGHNHGSKTRELGRAIRHFSVLKPEYKFCRPRKVRPEISLAQVRSPGRTGWHWVVVKGNKIYDGAFGRPDGTVRWPKDFRITSYLPLVRK